jgi:glycerol-3-phosphate acyltransferase PlsY
MALDVAKGAAAVAFAHLMNGGAALGATTGAAAVVGHIYPVWLRFHGGKGVAVAAGVFAVLAPLATAAAAALFVLTVWWTRYVSLGSIAATVALPPVAWLAGAPGAVVGAAGGSAALILFRHRANLRRLASGTERRMSRRRAPSESPR